MSVVVRYQEDDTMPMLAGVISQLLRAENIPCVLWGPGYRSLLAMEDSSHPHYRVDFVIEDENMNGAIRALRKAGFIEDGVGATCANCMHGPELEPEIIHQAIELGDSNYCFRANPHPITRSDYQSDHEFAAALKTLERRIGYTPRPSMYPHIGLFLKSQHMWTMPRFKLDIPREDDQCFMLASDIAFPGTKPLRRLRYSTAYGPVVTVNPVCFVKILILSVVRGAHLTGDVNFEESIPINLMRVADRVGPYFERDSHDILNYDRYSKRLRGIWMLINSIETKDKGMAAQFGKPATDDDEDALRKRILQVAKEMAEDFDFPETPTSWRFKPSQ
ncbi:hypothetical protein P170DRAFT_428406 [Aspergillus steynii IBT 23096]|uniref:Uncharacterized protein n=1 Tax=Aspergillus steynii IBT 23096 TaxID=1392250 RepID=A0A2I2G2T4_9EURO|nr:uncharacterized protein P170DRAFT_428406 [Aspergillus steynii IBT 23096]PLB47194.1 hypothetical protein P170DRAFT_428406 [Aspergillus steynii IBT 23096]